MPRKFGKVVVSGGDFRKKPMPNYVISLNQNSFVSVKPRELTVSWISLVELKRGYPIAFLVELKNRDDIFLFLSFSSLNNFVKRTASLDDTVYNLLKEYEKLFGGKRKGSKFEWRMIGDFSNSAFYDASYIFGGIIKRSYGMKRGCNYREYFRRAFLFEKLDNSTIVDMTDAYIYKSKVEWARKQMEAQRYELFNDEAENEKKTFKQNRKKLDYLKKGNVKNDTKGKEPIKNPAKIEEGISSDENGYSLSVGDNANRVRVKGFYNGEYTLITYSGRLKNIGSNKRVGCFIPIRSEKFQKEEKHFPVSVDDLMNIIYITQSNYACVNKYSKSTEELVIQKIDNENSR